MTEPLNLRDVERDVEDLRKRPGSQVATSVVREETLALVALVREARQLFDLIKDWCAKVQDKET
mgnify:CR=1 FL=1